MDYIYILNKMSYTKKKYLYSNTENGIQTSVRCLYNPKNDHITITSGFSNNKYINKNNKSTKSLYSKTDNGITTQIELIYNSNTNHITISSKFSKNRCNTGNTQTNQQCSTYLGIHISERILSKIFKNVKQMSYGNPGYDFICSRKYKIDVKSACRNKNKSNSWGFHIRRNTTADYFLCLVFDDRTGLNPEHIWLIPGHIVNDKTGIEIIESNLQKWSQYEQPIDKVISCCDTLRSDKL